MRHLSSSDQRVYTRTILVLVLALVLETYVAVCLGRYPRAGFTPLQELLSDPTAVSVLLNLRLPRIAAALLAGAALAASGFVFQMLFSNPLVEPGFLGVSQGAAFGAALAILSIGYNTVAIQLSAAVFGVLGLFISFTLARRFHFGGWILRLILSGIAVSAFFSSGLGVLKYLADPMSELQEITFWLLGGLWSVNWKQLLSITPVSLSMLCILFLFRWRINILSMDDRTAYSLGVSPALEKKGILLAATLATASVISITGLIGWVGLIIPHVSRRLFGANAEHALLGSMLIGASFVLFCDTLGRTLLSGELPLGIVSSLIGTTLFVLLLSSKKSLGENV